MKIYLIPTPIAPTGGQLPDVNRDIIDTIDYFIVENVRTARRFLATQSLSRTIDELTFAELSEHTNEIDIPRLLNPIVNNNRVCGLMSEAGLPCVADPGAMLVKAAHQHGVQIVPLVGPSSIMLALMSSGLSGQSFAFNGYIPLKEPERSRVLKKCVENVRHGQTQIFIETPYRNNNVLQTLAKNMPANYNICVALGLMSAEQKIKTQTAEQWLKANVTLPKEPAIFIVG